MTSSPITIFRARRVLTMNPARPEATHVAVRDGRILGAGPLEELAGWGTYTLDESFADKVLMPGFVEGHSHAAEGTFWRYTYLGRFDRMDPEGKVWPGARVHRGCRDAPAGGRAQARLADRGAGRLGPRPDLLRRPPRIARRLRSRVDDARDRRDACQRSHPQCEHARTGAVGPAAAGRQPSRHPARRRRTADRRAEGPRGDDDRRQSCRLRPRGAGQRRGRLAPLRQALRAPGRHHRDRSRQPVAGRGRVDDGKGHRARPDTPCASCRSAASRR